MGLIYQLVYNLSDRCTPCAGEAYQLLIVASPYVNGYGRHMID